MHSTSVQRPWYREFWPWFLMFFPTAAVVGGFITYYVAAGNSDGVVEDDYYKQGMTINRTLARDQAAAAMSLDGKLTLTGDNVSLTLTGNMAQWPAHLRLRILHPTRSGMDKTVMLEARGDGRYSAAFKLNTSGKWKLLLEDENNNWRLAGQLDAGYSATELKPVQ